MNETLAEALGSILAAEEGYTTTLADIGADEILDVHLEAVEKASEALNEMQDQLDIPDEHMQSVAGVLAFLIGSLAGMPHEHRTKVAADAVRILGTAAALRFADEVDVAAFAADPNTHEPVALLLGKGDEDSPVGYL